jgi:hypothetical protein
MTKRKSLATICGEFLLALISSGVTACCFGLFYGLVSLALWTWGGPAGQAVDQAVAEFLSRPVRDLFGDVLGGGGAWVLGGAILGALAGTGAVADENRKPRTGAVVAFVFLLLLVLVLPLLVLALEVMIAWSGR